MYRCAADVNILVCCRWRMGVCKPLYWSCAVPRNLLRLPLLSPPSYWALALRWVSNHTLCVHLLWSPEGCHVHLLLALLLVAAPGFEQQTNICSPLSPKLVGTDGCSGSSQSLKINANWEQPAMVSAVRAPGTQVSCFHPVVGSCHVLRDQNSDLENNAPPVLQKLPWRRNTQRWWRTVCGTYQAGGKAGKTMYSFVLGFWIVRGLVPAQTHLRWK